MSIQTPISSFLNGLVGVKRWTTQFKQIGEWANQGEGMLLYEIALAMESDGTALGIPELTVESMFDRILDCLALTPQPDFAEFASRLAMIPVPKARTPTARSFATRYRMTAQKLASSAESLVELFEAHHNDPKYQDFLACLLQERVLRGRSDAQAGPMLHFQEKLKRQGHPLSKLPLRLLSSESHLPEYLPSYSIRGSSWGMPFGPDADAIANPDSVRRSLPDREQGVVDPPGSEPAARVLIKNPHPSPSAAKIPAAVLNWAEESNGQYEACEIIASPSLSQAQITSELLLSCPLDCLKQAAPSDIRLQFASSAEVMDNLFSAAATGGAYNSGLGGAYGRLNAWESMAGLCGCAFDDAESVEAYLQTCRGWWLFEAKTDWFDQVAWDIGVMVLRPEGDVLAILAATDTD